MKADRCWWNDGRYECECMVFELKHGKAVVRNPWLLLSHDKKLTRQGREFVRKLVRMELEQ